MRSSADINAILWLRASGLPRPEIGKRYSLTAERIRQIEQRERLKSPTWDRVLTKALELKRFRRHPIPGFKRRFVDLMEQAGYGVCRVCHKAKCLRDDFSRSSQDEKSRICRICSTESTVAAYARNPTAHKRANRNSTARYPERQRARAKLYRAIRKRKIIRPKACSQCGACCKPHGHHADYSKPLEVQWLCALCHNKAHS